MFISCFLLGNDEGKEEEVNKGGKIDEDKEDVDEGGWLICNFLKLFNVFK